MDKHELQERLTAFAVRIIRMVDAMPNTLGSQTIAHQVVRSGTSPAANYRAACLAKSDKDFLNKLKMVEEELDETCHWLDMTIRSQSLPPSRVEPLYQECKELLSIIIKSIKTVKARLKADSLENR